MKVVIEIEFRMKFNILQNKFEFQAIIDSILMRLPISIVVC